MYDWVASLTSLGQWWDWQRQALPFLPHGDDGTALEIAHGTGHMLVELSRRGQKAAGLDLSPQMGKLARKFMARHNVTAPLIRGRVQALPIASHSLPSLLATFPTEFIIEPAALAEFRRVLQPGGRLVIVPSAVLKPVNLLQRLLRFAFIVTGQGTGEFADDQPDWPPRGREIFARNGFDLEVHKVELERSVVYVTVATPEQTGDSHLQ